MTDRLTYYRMKGKNICWYLKPGITQEQATAKLAAMEEAQEFENLSLSPSERVAALIELHAYRAAAPLEKVREITGLYPADDWDEDVGPVIWWRFDETNMPLIMPHIGSPLNVDWEENGYNDRYTHFTKIYCPTNEQVADALREEAMAALEKQEGDGS